MKEIGCHPVTCRWIWWTVWPARARDQKDLFELRLNETPKRWFVEDWTGIQESINVLDEVGSWWEIGHNLQYLISAHLSCGLKVREFGWKSEFQVLDCCGDFWYRHVGPILHLSLTFKLQIWYIQVLHRIHHIRHEQRLYECCCSLLYYQLYQNMWPQNLISLASCASDQGSGWNCYPRGCSFGTGAWVARTSALLIHAKSLRRAITSPPYSNIHFFQDSWCIDIGDRTRISTSVILTPLLWLTRQTHLLSKQTSSIDYSFFSVPSSLQCEKGYV